MQAQERLRQLIDEQQRRLAAGVPPDREAAILALVRRLDRLPDAPHDGPPDLITGRRRAGLGGKKALQLCLDGPASASSKGRPNDGDCLDEWAEHFLAGCERLVEAELVLAHCETGFMGLVGDGDRTFDAWITTKRAPARWRERADIGWWASWLASRYAPTLDTLLSQRREGDRAEDGGIEWYRRVADVHLAMMAYQLNYPPDTVIDGCAVQTYEDVLRELIARALQARDRGEAYAPRREASLIAELSGALAIDSQVIEQALAGFTIDPENAAYHTASPGAVAPTLIRIGADRIVWSLRGLTTEPFFFLLRELRRRAPDAYHNIAWMREAVFRKELYALFADKRFVTSPGRIQLRRERGDMRTDIDAVVFDRKTGTLGVFELKSQDPFARSSAELARQRDNVLYANRQIAGVLDWLKRQGADDLLARVDRQTAKRFRAHKVYPFVLGRYLVHFDDGPQPDRRAGWGIWPQILRLTGDEPFRGTEADPVASLFTRLAKDPPVIQVPANEPTQTVDLDTACLAVYPSYAAFKARK